MPKYFDMHVENDEPRVIDFDPYLCCNFCGRRAGWLLQRDGELDIAYCELHLDKVPVDA